MSPCADRDALLNAMLDNELDAANALEMEGHLKTCPGCAEWLASMKALRARMAEAELAERAPQRLRAGIEAMLAKEGRAHRPWWTQASAGWSAAGAMAAAACALVFVQVAPTQMAGGLEEQFVSDHVRSLQAAHLVDVETSDRHTVKPWFNGKIDYAPPVPNLADQGFPLAGGRLDYAGKRNVAALVYRRRAHVINLFVLPHDEGPAGEASGRRDSYSVVRWRSGDLDYWAVSDIDLPDLEAFRTAFISEAASQSGEPAAP